MKALKIALISSALLVSGYAISGTNSIRDLNRAVVTLLKDINNSKTKAALVFNKLAIAEAGVKDIAAKATLSKTGSKRGNKAAFQVSGKYSNPFDGSDPRTVLKGAAQLNLFNIWSQEQINEVGDGLGEWAQDIISGYTEEYGEAATVSAIVDNIVKDDKDNYQSATLTIDISIDTSKLPEDKPKEDVLFKKLHGVLAFDLKSAKAEVVIDSNLEYDGFKSDEQGLKEWVERILAQDESTLEQLKGFVQYIDSLAATAVEKREE